MKKQNKVFQKTRKQVSKSWKQYRTQKGKILKQRIPKILKDEVILQLRTKTKSKISEHYKVYQEFKHAVLPVDNFRPIAVHETFGNSKYAERGTIQKTFRTNKNYDVFNIDNDVQKFLNESNVIGVSVIFKVKDEDTEEIKYGSDFITIELFNRLQAKDISLFEHISNKLRYSKSMQDFEIINIDIRVIYAK